MGRKRKNITDALLLAGGRLRSRKYYSENKEECKRKALERYYSIKNASITPKS